MSNQLKRLTVCVLGEGDGVPFDDGLVDGVDLPPPALLSIFLPSVWFWVEFVLEMLVDVFGDGCGIATATVEATM